MVRSQVIGHYDDLPCDVLSLQLLLYVTEEVDPVEPVRRRANHELERFHEVRAGTKDVHARESFSVYYSLYWLIWSLPCLVLSRCIVCSKTRLVNKHYLALCNH